MSEVGHVGLDPLDGADQILQQIDIVKRLLNGHAGPGAARRAPGVHPVVVRGAKPFHDGIGLINFAKTPPLHGRANGLDGRARPALQHDADLDPRRSAGRLHHIHFAERHRRGLLHQEVPACPGGGEHGLRMQVVGR